MEVTKYVLHKNLKERTGSDESGVSDHSGNRQRQTAFETVGMSAGYGLDHLRIALVTDLHNRPYEDVVAAIREAGPDMIAVSGDLMCGVHHDITRPMEQENALGFLAAAAAIAPTFYAFGNHENFTDEYGYFVDVYPMEETGAILLDDSAVMWNGIYIGGLSSPTVHLPHEVSHYNRRRTDYVWEDNQLSGYEVKGRELVNEEAKDREVEGCKRKASEEAVPEPNLQWLEEFDRLDGFKILLCHQPEFYPRYLKSTSIDIVLSGHAHGGQWRFFGQGIFAPGQGLFPKLTSGVHDERLVISRGLANTANVPRFFNETELVIVDVV